VSEHAWTIRPASRRDVPELLEIETEQFPEPWSRSMIIEELADTITRRYSVAVDRGKVIGYLGLMFVDNEVHVNTLGVRRRLEGRGIATSLLEEALEAAKERGSIRVTLEVAVSNVRAQALYQRFGFAPVGVRRNYYSRVGEDALVLWADLVETGSTDAPTI
jgi:ribosomal-protein-alanine N-acetyltransferase